VSEQARGLDRAGERARRRTARKAIGAYHEEQLRLLLDRVRDGFARMNTGEIDAFDLDEVIHRYSDADPYNPAGAQALYGNGITATTLEGAGHITPDEGFGRWPFASEWCHAGQPHTWREPGGCSSI